MNREVTELWSRDLGAAGTVIRYGHWGRPVRVFPSERGRAWDFENNGMIAAAACVSGATVSPEKPCGLGGRRTA